MSKAISDSQSKLAVAVNNLSTTIALIIIASMCFVNSHDGLFVFDDSEAIVNNADVKDAPLEQLFQNDFWGTDLEHKQSHKSYRPLTILSFRLHYWFRGQLDPADFHTVNIILHTLLCIFTLYIFEILLECKEPQVSLHATLLFAVHPVHAEAVSGIVGRADILCALFMWLALFSYHKFINSDSILIQFNGILLCIINSAIAMFCKETGITILGICIIYDIVVVNKILPIDLIRIIRLTYPYEVVKQFIQLKLPALLRCLALVGAGFLLVLLRFRIMGFSKPEFQSIDNPASFVDNVFYKILNYNYIYCLNLWLLICPEWLCFDWSMGCIPLINGMDPRINFIILLWIVFGVFIRTIFSDKDRELTRQIIIGLALLIIPFLPASNLFFTVGFVIAERTLYIPSAGYCLLVAIGMKKFSTHVINPKVISIFYGALIVLLFARSWIRSDQWKTETSLFQSGLIVCPLNAKVHYNIGKNAADNGNISYAKTEYEEAIRLNPNYAQAMNNLGNLFKDENAYDKAERLLKKAVKLQNDFAAAWMNLGIVLSAQNKHKEAEKSYLTAISQRTTYPDCYYNLGLLYLAKNDHYKAFKAWDIATKQKPSHRQAWINMILLYDNLGQKEKALKIAEQALTFIPKEPSVHFNIGNILGRMEKFQQAEYHFKVAIGEDSKNPVYYTNLGVLYHRWNKYDKAEVMYRKALRLNPNSKTANDNLTKLKNLRLKKAKTS